MHHMTKREEASPDDAEVDPLALVTYKREFLSPDSLQSRYACQKCGKTYKWRGSLRNHIRLECGKEPQFHCYMCPHKTYQKGNLIRHFALFHKLKM